MARPARQSSSSTTTTTTITLENPVPSQTTTLTITLNPRKKKVTWKEGTVDNEFLQKKSSKKCCIFHKQKPFDEDSSDDEDCHAHDHDCGGFKEDDGASTSVDIWCQFRKRPMNFFMDPMKGRFTLRPADLSLSGLGKHACVDLTGVSPLVGLRKNGFVAGQTTRKAESKKVDKHAKASAANQHVFVSFAFDTFGSLAPEAIHSLTSIQRVAHINFSTLMGQGFVFGRLGFAIQKGLVAQLVARLPSVLM